MFSYVVTCPGTVPREIGNFGLRGLVSARLAGTIAVNVTQVMVSSKSVETGAQFRLLPPLHTAANSAGVRSALAQ